MMMCLVTDRHRLGAAAGTGPSGWIALLEQQAVAAAEAGVGLIQVREPDLEAGEMTHLVRHLVARTAHTPARIVVNDRLDVALAAGAAGVHLKQRSFTPETVRKLAPPGFLIGCSVHSVIAAATRPDADYFIAGTVLATPAKRSGQLLGWDGLAAVVVAAAGKPVLGIGGLGLPSIPLLVSTGAAGLAGIGAFIPPPGRNVVDFVQKRAIELRLAFDSARPVS